MRSITCISLTAVLVTAAPAVADGADDPRGCYQRIYSPTHLAENPDLTVAALVVEFSTRSISDLNAGDAVEDQTLAHVSALIADTDLTRKAGLSGRWFKTGLYCFPKKAHPTDAPWMRAGALTCAVDCDGGVFQVISQTSDDVLIRTDGIRLTDGETCGGEVRMTDEGAGPTTYRLFWAPAVACNGFGD